MRSLRRTLLTFILAGVSVAMFVAGTAVFLIARSSLHAQHDEALLDRANTLGSLVTEEEDGALELEYDQPLSEANIGVLVRITADDGTVIGQSPEWPAERTSLTLRLESDPIVMHATLPGGDRARVAVLAKRASRDPEAATSVSDRVVTVEVIGRTRGVQRAASAILVALIVGAILAILGSTVAVWLGIRRGLVPVGNLRRAVDDIDTSVLALPAEGKTYPDELGPIVAAIEGLLGRLRAAMERERRFTDAAAHELRTPIAELKTITDVTDRWPEPERLHRGIKDARIVIRQMEDLLESLLAAARGSSLDGGQPVETIALMPLAREVSNEAAERLERRDVPWSFEGDDASAWSGPRGVIVAIVRNLVENAAEYTPEGGSVRVCATGNGAGTVFEIENGPVALDDAAVGHIFEPFWRADDARSDRDHRGLGLAIVDSLATALGLERSAALTADQRLRVQLSDRESAGANGSAARAPA